MKHETNKTLTDILDVIKKIINDFDGNVYYPDVSVDDFYSDKPISDLKQIKNIKFSFNNKENTGILHNIDKIYDLVSSDEILRNKNRLRNLKIFVSHIASLIDAILDPKKALSKGAEPAYTTKIVSNSSTKEVQTKQADITRITQQIEEIEKTTTNQLELATLRSQLNLANEELEKIKTEQDTAPETNFAADLKKMFDMEYPDSGVQTIFKLANSMDVDLKIAEKNLEEQIMSKMRNEGELIRYKLAMGEFDPKYGKNGTSSNKLLADLLQKQILNKNITEYSKHPNIGIDGNCRHIFEIFERIYKRYVSGEQVTNGCDSIINLCINTGISIKIDENYKKSGSIFVMADFLKGEVTSENLKQYKCKYYDQKLGLLIDNQMSGNNPITSNWKVDSTRLLIESTDDDTQEPDIQPQNALPYNQPQNALPYNQPQKQANNVSINDYKSKIFVDFIINNKIIKDALSEYNVKTRSPIPENKVIDFIQERNPPLLNIITQWSELESNISDEIKRDWAVNNIRITTDIDKTIQIENAKLNPKFNADIRPDDKVRTEAKIREYNLYLSIAKELIKDGNSKLNITPSKGGKRKTIKRKITKRKITKRKTKKYIS